MMEYKSTDIKIKKLLKIIQDKKGYHYKLVDKIKEYIRCQICGYKFMNDKTRISYNYKRKIKSVAVCYRCRQKFELPNVSEI